ncbi:MAG: Acyl-CoA thioesterase [Alphaproteobacteria bacterium]|nr:Acyl-CoA thioesterase [Alphaproteobacteria bacterium]MDB5741642.1 Acyl-CoA thioesterase [Alphaproteobacteria bacterium]
MADTALSQLLALLDMEQIEDNIYRGHSPAEPVQRVFGGQVLAQALVAATRTVDPARPCHSFHAYFLRPGDPSTPILYEVDRSRDGASFTARRVVAIQHGVAIFTLAASFQRVEQGFEHQSQMPVVPPPEDLEDEQQVLLRRPDMPEAMRAWVARDRAFETRSVLSRGLGDRPARAAVDHIWLKTRGALPDDPAIHRALLAFVSDMSLLDTALLPHGKSIFSDVRVASLDHALWFHRPFRADAWLLYVQDSPSASGARGFNRGSLYTREGVLVASVAQEGLIRPR